MSLKALLEDLRGYSGIRQKKDIASIANKLENSFPLNGHPNGDDTAVIESAKGFDLLATEGFLTAFVERDPWFAGWCSIMVNVSDIAAMGGRPTAVVNTIWATQGRHLDEIYSGMVAASNAFNVPIVGGHTNLNTMSTHLSMSILGRANAILSSFSTKPDDVLIAAIDLRGQFRAPFLNWNAATSAPPDRLRSDLELLPFIAESGLAHGAKDISQAGVLGTCIMLLECSNVGANINLDNIPKPEGVTWHDWLRAFPSYGYIFATSKEKAAELIGLFHAKDISASQIGDVNQSCVVDVSSQGETVEFWNLEQENLMAMNELHQNLHNIEEQKYA
ncbi:sll0787 family AIR synthase-like protein [Alteromonas sp. 5E99-2]|uniref:sll0787 family AIR synthase-like protein n=1 Tax=Alteromonas sp. 5E99-2 TaxID=2817683 RepID=UPI001A98212C|nr:sll0787 family AIR synthase-like protein [Alteromonas sp. 5E99-2]MBO1255503.1 sll0787 family AIR synthase-like protein [Alteromonas sp. 5E99-2]